jgi:hypothetical protein
MSEVAETSTRKRRSRLPAGRVGTQLVVKELLGLGFDARPADNYTMKYDLLVNFGGMYSKQVQVRTTHLSPWYVRIKSLVAAGDQVTVYVLLGRERVEPARFFPTRNSDVVSDLRQPSDWKKFGFVDIVSVERYENSWDILKRDTE